MTPSSRSHAHAAVGQFASRAGRHSPLGTSALVALVALSFYASPARADIWGYVDAERIPHFAATQLDGRYELLLRDTVEPFKRIAQPAAPDAVPGASAVADATASAAAAALPATPAATLSPKMVSFFERSKGYKAVKPLLREAAKTYGVDYSLLKALITMESGFDSGAVSPKGAVGLMQLIPPTAERYGVTNSKNLTIEQKLTDPKINIRAGARYLAYLIKMFPGQLELALAAYNAGEGAVQRAGNKIPNYPETKHYVKTVMQIYSGLGPAPAKAVPLPKADASSNGLAVSRGRLLETAAPLATAPATGDAVPSQRIRVEMDAGGKPGGGVIPLPLAEPNRPTVRGESVKS